MARLVVASALRRWLPGDGELALDAEASTLNDALDALFAAHPQARGYVLDDRGRVRHHVALFVDGHAVKDLAHPLAPASEVYVMQALSGG